MRAINSLTRVFGCALADVLECARDQVGHVLIGKLVVHDTALLAVRDESSLAQKRSWWLVADSLSGRLAAMSQTHRSLALRAAEMRRRVGSATALSSALASFALWCREWRLWLSLPPPGAGIKLRRWCRCFRAHAWFESSWFWVV